MVKVRIVVLVALALTVAACSSSQTVLPTTRAPSTTTVPPTTQPVPAVDVSATPSGWVPVAYGDAQVSVPATFCEVATTPDSLFIGSPSGASTIFSCGPEGRVGSQSTVVNLVSIRQVPRPYAGEKPTIRNGVPVYLCQHSGDEFSYFAPSVGIEISAGGPLARRVVDSLTRSPRAIVLAVGPAPAGALIVAFADVRGHEVRGSRRLAGAKAEPVFRVLL